MNLRHIWNGIAVCLLLLMIPMMGICVDAPDALPIEAANAVMLKSDEGTLLVGCSDAEAIGSVKNLLGVVQICDHAEHCAQVQEVASAYGVPVYAAGDTLPLANAVWESGSLQITSGNDTYLFAANTAKPGTIAFGCNGKLLPSKGKTNQASVNVRKSTSTKSNQVGKLKRGDTLTILGILFNEAGEYWYQVELSDGTVGHIRADLISAAIGDEAQVEKAAVQKAENRYIGNKKSKVYHLPSCHTLPSSKNMVYLDSKDYAATKGYRPCKNCDP